MTAAHQRRAALEVVPDPDETAPAPAVSDDWRSSTVIDQWSPEHQFVGSLLWLSAEQARPLLDLVPDIAIWRPQTRWELIGSLVDDGRDPDPVSVLNRAKHHPDAQALQPDTAPTPGQHHRLAVCLSDLYTNTVNHHAAPDHARDTLDEAYRRAFREQGIRMQQVSETTSSRAELTEQFVIIRDQLVDLWQRAQATTVPGWWRADPAEDTDIR